MVSSAALVRAKIEEAAAAWRAFIIDPEYFARFLEERLPTDTDPSNVIEAWCVADLYLACGCALGDEAALDLFEENYLNAVPTHLAKLDGASDIADEVRQHLRTHLLVGEGVPKITQYNGRGALRSFVRVSALRVALNLLRSRRGEKPLEGLEVIVEANPELAYLRSTAAREIEGALRIALEGLDPGDRTLLKLHFLDGLGTPQIAALMRTHRTTIRRRINDCRHMLLARTRAELRRKLKLGDVEIDSWVRAAGDQLEISLSLLTTDEHVIV